MPVKVMKARQIYDSCGVPTVEVEVRNEKDTAVASVPGGTTASARQAVELRDNEQRNWQGKGVMKAIDNVNSIISSLFVGKDVDETNQSLVDTLLLETDRTPYKSRLGANAIAAVSMAMARLGAMKNGVPLYSHIASLAGTKETDDFLLPVPMVPIMAGGFNSNSQLFFEEIYIMPTDFASFNSAMRAVSEVYQQLKFIIAKSYGLQYTNVGICGQLSAPVKNEVEALELVKKAIERAMCTGFMKVALNANATNFFKNGFYELDIPIGYTSSERSLDSFQLADLYRGLLIDYSIISVEDPFHFEDKAAWNAFTAKTSIQVAGGQFLASNPLLVTDAISAKACNCLVLKLNQLGTVTECIDLFKQVKKAGWSCVVSDRYNETEDSFMADLAVGLNAGQIRCGAPCRYERLCKYNQLLRIEEKLGSRALFAGHKFRKLNIT